MDDVDRNILAFERQWFRFGGRKVAAMHAEFGMSPWIYHARLNRLLDQPDAMLADPELVKRLRRVRDSRARQRGRRASRVCA